MKRLSILIVVLLAELTCFPAADARLLVINGEKKYLLDHILQAQLDAYDRKDNPFQNTDVFKFENQQCIRKGTVLNTTDKESLESIAQDNCVYIPSYTTKKRFRAYETYGAIITGIKDETLAKLILTEFTKHHIAQLMLDPQSEILKTTFKAIQDIHSIAAAVAQEVKPYEVSWLQSGVEGWPGSNPFYCQTLQGLYLSTESYPESLHTPWGKVAIYGSASYCGSGIKMVFAAFCRHLKLAFVKSLGEHAHHEKHKIKLYLDDFSQEISQQELEQYRGTNRRIITDYCGYPSIYKILAINDVSLPEPKNISRDEYRDIDTVNESWEAMMKQHQTTRL